MTDQCPKCGGRVGVLNTLVIAGVVRVQYLGCKRCHWRPADNKRVFPIATRSNQERSQLSTTG